MMTTSELSAWLAPTEGYRLTDADLTLLGSIAAPGSLEPRLAFVLALLRDLFATDDEVLEWLMVAHQEYDGETAIRILECGELGRVEAVLVGLWNGRVIGMAVAA
jgi:hypothetical protein